MVHHLSNLLVFSALVCIGPPIPGSGQSGVPSLAGRHGGSAIAEPADGQTKETRQAFIAYMKASFTGTKKDSYLVKGGGDELTELILIDPTPSPSAEYVRATLHSLQKDRIYKDFLREGFSRLSFTIGKTTHRFQITDKGLVETFK